MFYVNQLSDEEDNEDGRAHNMCALVRAETQFILEGWDGGGAIVRGKIVFLIRHEC